MDVYEQIIISTGIIHVLEDQNHFWEKVHKLWVNGYLFGKSNFGGEFIHSHGATITLGWTLNTLFCRVSKPILKSGKG